MSVKLERKMIFLNKSLMGLGEYLNMDWTQIELYFKIYGTQLYMYPRTTRGSSIRSKRFYWVSVRIYDRYMSAKL